MDSLTIRDAQLQDVPDIVEMWWEMELSHLPYDEKFYSFRDKDSCTQLRTRQFEEIIKDLPDHLLIVAESDGRLVGYVHACIQPTIRILTHTKSLVIGSGVFVRPEYRRKGICRMMFQRLEEFARERGADFIRLNVHRDNPAVQAYTRMGFHTKDYEMLKWL